MLLSVRVQTLGECYGEVVKNGGSSGSGFH